VCLCCGTEVIRTHTESRLERVGLLALQYGKDALSPSPRRYGMVSRRDTQAFVLKALHLYTQHTNPNTTKHNSAIIYFY